MLKKILTISDIKFVQLSLLVCSPAVVFLLLVSIFTADEYERSDVLWYIPAILVTVSVLSFVVSISRLGRINGLVSLLILLLLFFVIVTIGASFEAFESVLSVLLLSSVFLLIALGSALHHIFINRDRVRILVLVSPFILLYLWEFIVADLLWQLGVIQ